MSTIAPACPKCQGEMIQGFVVDHTYGAVVLNYWVEGPPQRSFWTGIKVPPMKSVPIGTFRCASCGYLESYARREFRVQG
jgi:hypothetical protein